jgi:DNA-binding response OmpR family regulator
MAKKILVVDDEPKIVDICRDYLQAAGYEVIQTGDGLRVMAMVQQERPDLVVLDLMLPGMNGLDVCRELRRESTVPIIMLTARVEETDKLIGLELGADDYLTKPFSPRELVARVKTVLRRTSGGQAVEIIHVGDLELDRGRFLVKLKGQGEVMLTPTEFELLALLSSQPGRIFSRAQLLEAVRGASFESYERAIDSHIRNLRRKIEPQEDQPRYIQTVYGVGYKLEP